MHNPLWFLIVALFLPRIALFVGWLEGWSMGVNPPLVALLLWAFLPRVLVLISVYTLQGIGFWFFLHLAAAVIAWSGSAGYVSKRRYSSRED
jgi:hypothetical protein